MLRLLLAVIGLIVLFLGSVLALDGCSSTSGNPNDNNNTEEPDVTTDIIVARLKEISELASLRITASGIVHGEQPGRRFYQGTSRMVLLVRGEAIYSVDLTDASIELSDSALTIGLPPPEITAAWVDVERTKIWTRIRGRFREDFSEKLERACWEAAHELVVQSAARSRHKQTAIQSVEALIGRVVHEIDPALDLELHWRHQSEHHEQS